MQDYIEIALAADGKYFVGLATTAASIAIGASKGVGLSFNFLDGGFADEEYHELCLKLEHLHPYVRCRRFKVDESLFANFPDWRGNKMAYARFLLPKLLENAKHVIYCDVDFLWLADIYKLWQQRDDKVILQAVHDPQVCEIPQNQDWFVSRGYRYDVDRYFCSGLLLINLELFRQENAVQDIYIFLREHPDVMFPDQDALNHLLEKRVRLLDEKWMRFTKYLRSDDFNKPIVCHFVNDVPWRGQSLLLTARDATMAWKMLAQRIGLRRLTIKEKVLYLITRNSLLKYIVYFGLYCIGKGCRVIFLRTRCAYKVKSLIKGLSH